MDYTVKNETTETIKVAGEKVSAGACIQLSDDLFGFAGDFPITITKEEGSALSSSAPAGKYYEANNYIVSSESTEPVKETDSACDVSEKKAEDSVKKEEEADKTN